MKRFDDEMTKAMTRPTMLGLLTMVLLAGCVQIDTPDKPIVINLNITIKQEIAVKLDGSAKELIEENAEIF